MSELIITESSLRKSNLTYLYSALSEIINQVDARVDIKNGKNRTELKISIPDEYKNVVLTETEDKIADVIVINYKYKHFKKNISISGLSSAEKELLYVALISSDFEEDLIDSLTISPRAKPVPICAPKPAIPGLFAASRIAFAD